MACNAQILELVMGLPKIVNDTQSAEQGLSVLSLLQGMSDDGFAITDWQPAIAGSKPNSIWADSAISAGRTLISAEDANATEIINLVCSGSTWPLLNARIKTLYKFRESAQNFWETDWQVEPIYLKWLAIDGVGPQYALIVSMDIVVSYPDVEQQTPLADVIITIEREPYWRPLPPGSNPKLWSLALANLQPLESLVSLLDSTNHLFYQNIKNTREWNTTQTALTSQNFVDIPASLIPGDAPALVELSIGVSGSGADSPDSILVGRSTKPISLPLQAGGERSPVLTLNAGDGNVGTDTTKGADTSAPASNSSATGVRTTTTFATPTLAARVNWNDVSLTVIDSTSLRGQYACFLRCRLSAAGVVNINLRIDGAYTTIPIIVDTVIASPNWNFVNLGQIQIPLEEGRIEVSGLGIGIKTKSDLTITIEASRTSGTAQLQIADLFLLPIDECSLLLDAQGITVAGVGRSTILDNTGYFAHGGLDEIGRVLSSTDTRVTVTSVQGRDITLQPGVNNRLHFIVFQASPKQSDLRAANRNMDIRLNIIPRWRGIRDQ